MADTRRNISPELRVAVFYFTLLMTLGVATAYSGIWFASQGLTPGEIGLIGSVPVLIMLVLNLVVGRLADRADDWRQTIVAGALIAAVVPFGLFVAKGFWPILVIWSLAALPVTAIQPVADAATVRLTRRTGGEFGSIRAWGTIGYMAALLLTGLLVSAFGGSAFLPVFAVFAVLRGAAALALPRFRGSNDGAELVQPVGARHLREVMRPWFLLPLVGYAMIYATHLILSTFQALVWADQGLSAFVIALLVAVGAASEATMMFVFRRFSKRFSARHLVLVSAVVSALRWAVMAFSPPVPVLFGLQLLHSVTFAMGYLGCVNFIANWTSDDIAAEAQAFFQMLQQAMSVVAVAAFGWIVAAYGGHAFLASAAFAAMGAALIFASLRMQPPRPADS